MHILSSGDEAPVISVQNELEKIADFRSLPDARKIAARLELLLSSAPGSQAHDHLTIRDFELIPEPQPADESGGCGFIPEDMLEELLQRRLPSNMKAAKRARSIQVRIAGPQIGVVKGKLRAKRGITNIQLPPSTRKVPPSVYPDPADWVFLLITNVFPSKSNHVIGKWLATQQPPIKSYGHHKFSPMFQTIFRALGVPLQLLVDYIGEVSLTYLCSDSLT
jgi:hypothetical protein